MPSTNKLSSRTTRSIARFLLSFCGLASFGVATMALTIAAVFSVAILGSDKTYAISSGNTITANLPGSVAIRLLNAEGTAEISSLDFNNLTPTPQGTTASKSFIVDVATSNPTGYKLYMQSDYKIDDGDNDSSNDIYTTNLTHTDSDVTDNIPTSTTSGSKVYWNYVNPLTNSGSSNPTPSVIPPYGTPDKIAQYFSPTNSHQSTIDINVGIDTTIVSGTYENQLLFSAVGNPTNLDYSITFNMDGGEPQIAKIEDTAAAGTYTTTLPSTTPTKADYLFSHWQIVSTTSATASCSSNSSNNNNGNNNDNSTQETSSTTICNPGDTITIHSGIDQEGDFVGDITLLAIYDNAYTYTITYDCNGGTGCPSNSSYGPTTDTSYSYTIPEATIEKTGYDFTGLLGSDDTTYNIGDTVTIESTAPDFTLTAQFKQSAFDGITTMQQMTKSICDNASLEDSATLIDTGEPDKSYSIAKLADNNCWMTTNYNRSSGTLTSENYNVSSSGYTIPTSYCTTSFNGYCDGTSQTSTSAYGGYYNWSTATAGSNSTTYSICPKGWRLPTNAEFTNLISTYSASSKGSNLATGDPKMQYGGYCSPGSYACGYDSGNGGRYWSSTVSGSNSYVLYFNSLSASTVVADRSVGFSVRCVANESIHQLTVDPAGGTWSGSTDVQKFTGEAGSSKTISNPIAPADIDSYSISYDDNGQSAIFDPIPTTAKKTFSNWAISGVGTIAGNTFQFGNGDAIIVAQYNNATLNLPDITKAGSSCSWLSGEEVYSSGQHNVTVTSNTTFTAICVPDVIVTNTNTVSNKSSLTIPYGDSTTVTVTPNSGYYLSGVSCPSGYTCSGYSTGSHITGQQTITVTNNKYSAGGTLTFSGTSLTALQQACNNASVGNTFTYSSVQYRKLADNRCYTSQNRGYGTWYNSGSKCPSGTAPPSKDEFITLLDKYPGRTTLYNATGLTGDFWSSTEYEDDSSQAYVLYISSSEQHGTAYTHYSKTLNLYTMCIIK